MNTCECNEVKTITSAIKFCALCGRDFSIPLKVFVVGDIWTDTIGYNWLIIAITDQKIIIEKEGNNNCIGWRFLDGTVANKIREGNLQRKYVKPITKDCWLMLYNPPNSDEVFICQFSEEPDLSSYHRYKILSVKKVTMTQDRFDGRV